MDRWTALIVCAVAIGYFFRRDLARPDQPSHALWLPFIWMFLAGSRWASSWLDLGIPLQSADDYAEGSPVDRAVFLSLILAAAAVLIRRRIPWMALIRQNGVIVLYLLFCLSSVLWTNDPIVLVKRWVKDLGNPLMALIILTERRPYEALATVLRRVSVVLVLLSALFVRYFPDLGRTYHADGSPMFTGVGHQKNDLGLLCLIAGIYIAWELIERDRVIGRSASARLATLALAALAAWLLYMSNSQTSLVCLVTSIGILIMARLPFIRVAPRRIVPLLAGLAVLGVLLQETFDIRSLVLEAIGRDASLTNRTELWGIVRSLEVNSVIGAGFMSFWSGSRMETIWHALGPGVNQAHNGYLEQYLNLGYVGVAFIVMILLVAFVKIYGHLRWQPSYAMLRLCFVVSAALYNYTEASFYGMNNMWLLLLLSSTDISAQHLRRIRIERRVLARAPSIT